MQKCGTASHGNGDCGERAWGDYLGRNLNHRAGTSARADCFALGFAGDPQRPGQIPSEIGGCGFIFLKIYMDATVLSCPFNEIQTGLADAPGRRRAPEFQLSRAILPARGSYCST